MPSYLYASNVSPRDRFEQFQLMLDNGRIVVLSQGSTYSLTSSELGRARRYVVLVDSTSIPERPQEVGNIPIVGELQDGDVLVWDASIGAFVPGAGGGGGGGSGNTRTLLWDTNTSTYDHPEWHADSSEPRIFAGPTLPMDVGITMVFGDTWTPSEGPA